MEFEISLHIGSSMLCIGINLRVFKNLFLLPSYYKNPDKETGRTLRYLTVSCFYAILDK